MARWRRSAGEGKRLTCALFTLQTTTIVTSEPSAKVLPSMQAMLTQLHETYTDVIGMPATATFRDMHDEVVNRHGDGVLLGHPHERIIRHGKELHDIVTKAGDPAGGSVAVDERKLEPVDAARIAKTWEQADDTINLTTSVSLETGEAITRFAYPPGTSLPSELVAFHEDMTTLSLHTWGALGRLASQFLSSTVRVIRSFAYSRTTSGGIWRRSRRRDEADDDGAHGGRWRRLAPGAAGWSTSAVRLTPADGASTARDALPAAAHALFGRGGKLFITNGADGTAGALRTLVQLQGDIVTRVTPEVLHDEDALSEHRAKIDAWFVKLNRDWMYLRVTLTTALSGAGAVLLYRDIVVIRHQPAAHWAQLALPLVPLGLRKAIAVVAHRMLLHAIEGPQTLRPSKKPAPLPARERASRHLVRQ